MTESSSEIPAVQGAPQPPAPAENNYMNLGISAGLLTATIISAGGWMLSTVVDHKARIHRLEEAVKSGEEIKEQLRNIREDLKDAKRDLERRLERTQDDYRRSVHSHKPIPNSKPM